MQEDLLKVYIRALLESDELKEFCGVGGGMIQGYTLPLGMQPNIPVASKKRKKKNKKSK